MAQPDPEAINLGDVPPGEEEMATGYGIIYLTFHKPYSLISHFRHGWIGRHRDSYPPEPGRNQPSERASFVDGSGPLFSMYVDMTAEQDRDRAKSWKGDADGILVFVSTNITLFVL